MSDPAALLRSDFFPGLGWMLTARVWRTLAPAWPEAYWDDWMRSDAVRRGRQCVRPEVSRTYNFGERGSSVGQFFRAHLRDIRLNDAFVRFTARDLGYLRADAFERLLRAAVCGATAVRVEDVAAMQRRREREREGEALPPLRPSEGGGPPRFLRAEGER